MFIHMSKADKSVQKEIGYILVSTLDSIWLNFYTQSFENDNSYLKCFKTRLQRKYRNHTCSLLTAFFFQTFASRNKQKPQVWTSTFYSIFLFKYSSPLGA